VLRRLPILVVIAISALVAEFQWIAFKLEVLSW
jgi:hypothetical protein